MLRAMSLCAVFALLVVLAGCGSGPRMVQDFEAQTDPGLEPVWDVDLDFDGVDDVAGDLFVRRSRMDTFIHQGYPTTNFGKKFALRCGNYPSGDARRCLLKFNLTSIPQTATVNKAFLYLYVMKLQQGEERYKVHRVTGPWKELAVTWSTAPTYSAGFSAVRTLIPSMVGKRVRWNITSLAQDWVSTPTRNFGCLMIGPETASYRGAVFGSRENPAGSKRPRIKVDYTP